jgi:hypothetical protein
MSYPKISTLRSASPVNAKLNQRLATYASAASAAGVAMLAVTSSAEAKIVYTPANRLMVFGVNAIDLNGDGIPDFNVSWKVLGSGSFTYGTYVGVLGVSRPADGVMSSAAALPWGVRVGPKAQFRSLGLLVLDSGTCDRACSSKGRGAWAGVYNRFLGVKFSISKQTHYGWINIDMRSRTILGYAYETNANQPIVTGHKSGPVEAGSMKTGSKEIDAAGPAQALATNQPATLGALALGADGLSLWRREEE